MNTKTFFSQQSIVAIIFSVMMILFFNSKSSAQFTLSSQQEKVNTRNGNEQFQNEKYADAEASYKKALDVKNNFPEAVFNLGDAIYKQKRYDDAAKQFQLSAQTNADESVKAKAYYNQGNSFMEQKKWEDAIKAYKNSLKLNPKDADAKYNLAYANSKLKKDQGGGGQDKNQKQKDQQNKDQQKKDQNKDKQDQKKDQQQQQQDGKDQKQNQQQKQGEKPKMSKEDAEKLLKALADEEKKTNQKMQQKQVKVGTVKIKKDW